MNADLGGFVAEAVGTFLLIFLGCGSLCAAKLLRIPLPYVAPALIFSLVLVLLIYTLAHFSAANFNPAVTLALLLSGQLAMHTSIIYFSGQLCGALAAAGALKLLILFLQ